MDYHSYVSLSLHLVLLFILTLSLLIPSSLSQQPPPIKAQNGVAKMELWCVAKNNADDASLQAAIDWACGLGGANCVPIQQGGLCYDPADIVKTASFVFNDYYLKHGLTDDSCYFANTAAVTSLNPSHGKCQFPSSLTVNNVSASGTSPSVGLGPSYADMSQGNHIAPGWYLSLAFGHFFVTIYWMIR